MRRNIAIFYRESVFSDGLFKKLMGLDALLRLAPGSGISGNFGGTVGFKRVRQRANQSHSGVNFSMNVRGSETWRRRRCQIATA
jgi:hypothetical protein